MKPEPSPEPPSKRAAQEAGPAATAAATSAGASPPPPNYFLLFPPSSSSSSRHYTRNPSAASWLHRSLCCNLFTQIPNGASRWSPYLPFLLLASLPMDLKCLSQLLIPVSRPHLAVPTPDGCCVASVIIHTCMYQNRLTVLHIPANLGSASAPRTSAILILSSSL